MASLTYEAGNRNGFRVRIYLTPERRVSIWLGDIDRQVAEEAAKHSEEIAIAYRNHGLIPAATLDWLNRQTPKLRKKFARFVNHERKWTECVALFLHSKRNDVEARTLEAMQYDLDMLLQWVEDVPLHSVTTEVLRNYEALLRQSYSEGTVGKLIRRWNAFFKFCKQQGWIEKDLRMRPNVASRPATYFVNADEGPRRIKIGFTAGKFETRLSGLQTDSPVALSMIGYVEGDREAELHDRFRRYHWRGDWFHASEELLAFIEANAIPLNIKG